MTAVENKIPNVSILVKKKTDYNIKISEIEKKLTDHSHDKYITKSEFNKVTKEVFDVRLKQANLVRRTEFDNKLRSLKQNLKINWEVSIKEITQIKQNIYLLKMNQNN